VSHQHPLAERLRPATLDAFIGQEHLKQKVESLLKNTRPQSLLLFGPPGCGKSTLALLIANRCGLTFARISAPETNLSTLRKQLAHIELLILDEIHRFSKTQQDFFLPLLETGDLVLLATTTENPSFSVTKQLISRLHVLRLRPLAGSELKKLGRKGQEALDLKLSPEGLDLIARVSHGDARTLFNLLEYIAELPEEVLHR